MMFFVIQVSTLDLSAVGLSLQNLKGPSTPNNGVLGLRYVFGT